MNTVQTAKSQRTEAELKAAARRLILRQGYAQTKITDITKEAGKAAGSFYRYFTDKDDLMRSLAEDFLASHRDHAHGTLGPDHRFATRDDVRAHVEAYWENSRRHLAEMTGIFQAAQADEAFARTWESLRSHHVAMWADHIEQMRGPREDNTLTAQAIVCMLESFCYAQLRSSPENATMAIDVLTDLVMHGIAPDATP